MCFGGGSSVTRDPVLPKPASVPLEDLAKSAVQASPSAQNDTPAPVKKTSSGTGLSIPV